MKKVTMSVLALILCLAMLAGCQPANTVPANSVHTLDDLWGKKIGVQANTTGDIYASDYEKPTDAAEVDDTVEYSTVERYDKGNDAVMALTQGKLDCVIIDNEPAKSFVAANKDLKVLEEPFAIEEYAIAMAKESTDLLADFNTALANLKADGTLDKIIDGYINGGDFKYESTLTEYPNGTLIMATNAYFPPYEFYDGGKIVGIDADIATAICDQLGYELKIEDMDFGAVLTAVQTGKAHFGMAGMTVNETRLQSVNFTDSYTTATQVIIVRSK